MFTPIDRLPGIDTAERKRLQDRWETKQGRRTHEHVLQLIRKGAGEDFLQSDFESGQLSPLEDMWDLRGFTIQGEAFAFEGGGTFEAIDFSLSKFYNTTFDYAVFDGSGMRFGRLFGCTFQRCIFVYSSFFATTFSNCIFRDCDFIDSCGFTNCDFTDTTFERCFIRVPTFIDCRLDNACEVINLTNAPTHPFQGDLNLKQRADVFQGISDAYRIGRASAKSRHFLFQAQQAATRHNRSGLDQVIDFGREYLFGYGIRPVRVLFALGLLLGIGTAIFATQVSVGEALLIAAGALLTFGAHADRLDTICRAYTVVYVVLAFAGISLTALFAAVSARVFFAE